MKATVSCEVFVDTSAWIAVSNLRDRYHASATVEYKRLISARCRFTTTNLVVAETYTLVRRSAGHARAIRLLHSLHTSPRLHISYSDSGVESIATEILERHRDQDFSYTDAVSFAVMQQGSIRQAFTYDSHFAVMRFELLPV